MHFHSYSHFLDDCVLKKGFLMHIRHGKFHFSSRQGRPAKRIQMFASLCVRQDVTDKCWYKSGTLTCVLCVCVVCVCVCVHLSESRTLTITLDPRRESMRRYWCYRKHSKSTRYWCYRNFFPHTSYTVFTVFWQINKQINTRGEKVCSQIPLYLRKHSSQKEALFSFCQIFWEIGKEIVVDLIFGAFELSELNSKWCMRFWLYSKQTFHT